jgi:hypothetical protein
MAAPPEQVTVPVRTITVVEQAAELKLFEQFKLYVVVELIGP